MTKLQFRVLYRQFLFRIVDLETLSPHAQGDAHGLLGRFAALLVFVSAALTLPAIFSLSGARSADSATGLVAAMITQHFLIATTMLAVGLFAVLSWEAMFPDRRDVMVLGPLPVSARTMFLAKVAATATALGLTIALLHCATGLVWPLAFAARAAPAVLPALTFSPARSPMAASDVQADLNESLRQALTSGGLAPGKGVGLAVGVWQQGQSRAFTYGAAQPDSLFEIGSISKTFTGLMLARMAAEGKVRLDEPVRELLPKGTVAKPDGAEITLLDLATHRSGLPRMPGNFRPADRANPYADYGPRQLYAYLASRGVAKTADAGYRYSNLGLGLLGQALAVRAGKSYGDQLRDEVTGPLGMNDTVIALSGGQQRRFLQGHDGKNVPVHAWDLDGLAGAGAIRSTVSDMLLYLEANLHPERYDSLAGALALSQRLRANAAGGAQIALAWTYSATSGTYRHGGATAGFSSHAFFSPKADCAAVLLLNRGPSVSLSSDLIAEHIRQRLMGEPAISLDNVEVPASSGAWGVLRSYCAYWFTMLAAGVFVFGCVLCLQGFAQALPRRLFLRFAGYLQLAAFAAIVCLFFLQPGFGGLDDLTAASIWRVIQWLPSYWFLALYQQSNGSMHPALEPLVWRAWIGLAVVPGCAAAAYAMSYWRTLRKIAEDPDIAPGMHGRNWLPSFGGPVGTAVGQFSVRTLLRSRQHRLILAFYLGAGLAITSLLLKDPSTKRPFTEGSASNPWEEASVALWASSIAVTVLAVVGTRMAFALPVDLRANWIFRVTGVPAGRQTSSASRRALRLLAVIPVWIVSAVVCQWLWPSWQSSVHLVALGLLGLTLVELCLARFRKIPFACSYLPGKSRIHMAALGAMGLLLGAINAALAERRAVRELQTAVAMIAFLAAVWMAARWWARRTAQSEDAELAFEEQDPHSVQGLGLEGNTVALPQR